MPIKFRNLFSCGTNFSVTSHSGFYVCVCALLLLLPSTFSAAQSVNAQSVAATTSSSSTTATAAAAASATQQKLLTIDDIFDPQKRVNFTGNIPQLRWLPDGKSYVQIKFNTQTRAAEIIKIDALTGAVSPFADTQKIAAAFGKIEGISPDQAKRFALGVGWENNPANNAFYTTNGTDLFVYDFTTNQAKRLSAMPDEGVAAWSPDGRQIAFVREHNLYVVDVASGTTKQLTTDGTPKIFNGIFNWVYQEELYGRGNFKAFWWSPDSKQIAFLQLNDAPVPEFAVVDHIPANQEVEDTPYPKAGDPNPTVKLGIIAAQGGAVRFINTSAYKPEDFLISRVEWTPDNQVIFQAQDREQHFLDLMKVDSTSGTAAAAATLVFREGAPPNEPSADGAKPRPWVEVIDNPTFLKDGSFLLWLSDRTGFRHLYHYSPNGKLIKQITNGDWEIRELHGVDAANNFAYFTATEHSAIAPHAYRIKLDGTGLTRLTQTEGAHNANFNSTFTHFIDVTSDAMTPPKTLLLHAADGKLVRVIEENKPVKLAEYKLAKPEFMKVKTRDGFEMEAMMIRPPDFDSTKKYPVFSYTYSGPQAPSVRNAWGGAAYLWYQMLAQKGYIIWICDNRSASGKGVQPTWTSNRNFGEGELRDLEDGVSYLKSLPFVDGARIGLSGWSFGGFMTSYALTHSNSFKIGIAGGSVTDWKLYDSIYTERYMGTPQTNPTGYARSSVQAAAGNLNGKLLLIHGTMDDNVHLQNTVQLSYALQKAGKQFDLMVYPKSRHGVTDPQLVKHMRQMMTDFITKNL